MAPRLTRFRPTLARLARTTSAALPLAFLPVVSAGEPGPAPSPNYQAADRFAPANLRPFLYDTEVEPQWIGKTDTFWYAYSTSEGTKFYKVNPQLGTKEPLLHLDKLATAVSEAVGKPLDPAQLAINRMSVNAEGTKFKFVFEDLQYEYDLTKDSLAKLGKAPPLPQAGAPGQGQGRGRGGQNGRNRYEREDQRNDQQDQQQNNDGQNRQEQQQQNDGQNRVEQLDRRDEREERVVDEGRRRDGDGQVRVDQQLQLDRDGQPPQPNRRPTQTYRSTSPDGKKVVYAKNHNLFLADAGKEDEAVPLTSDGVEDYSYAAGFGRGGGGGGTNANGATPPPFDPNRKVRAAVNWSPDSKAFTVSRTDGRGVKDLFVINSLATPRPTLEKYKYPMPGEEDARHPELYVYNLEKKILTRIPPLWKDETYTNIHWGKTAQDLRFIRRDRLIRHVDFCKVDALKNEVKSLIREGYETANITFKPARYLDDTNEMIWWSERTGWGHFYLYDRDGKLKNAITSGAFRAINVVEVDAKNRLLYFTANAREPKENLYDEHLYRVNLDGTGLTLMDPGPANHRSYLSPSRQFLVDNASRVDLAPAAVVRAADGHEVMPLETTDLAHLTESGWKLPETFVVKAADGVTDLYGNMWKPFDFDPKKSYPIIVHVYPGPQQEGTVHTFTASSGEQQLAQVGFVVIQVGHRGGAPTRSKAYHSYGYFNLRDYGLADKKAAVEQLAARYPFINVNRVGIYGHSGGGFMTAAALLQKPYNDFFKVGVSTSGNHDNNIYGANWAETYHGLREVALNDAAKKTETDATGTGTGAGRAAGRGRAARGADDRSDPVFDELEDADDDGELDEFVPILGDEQKADEKKADDKKDEDAKAEDKKTDEKKADEKSTEAKADDKKVEEKKADEAKAEDKKVEDKKAEDKKADEKSTEAKADSEKKDEAKKVETAKKDLPKTKFEISVPTNAELAANLRGRLLLVHGELDNNVHPANTLRLVDALIKANKRFDMLYLPGKRHAYEDYQNYMNQRMIEYFAEHLLDDYQTSADIGEKAPFRKKD